MLLRRIAFAGCLLALSLSASTARAVDPKILPNDTEVVISSNLKQMMESEFAKANKAVIEKAMEQAKSKIDESPAKKYLEKAGFDPMKDLHSVTIAGPAAKDLDSGFIVIEGKFDIEKFNSAAEDAAKDNGDALKVHKIGGKTVFEITPNGEKTVFASLISPSTMVAASNKEGLADGISRLGGGKTSKLNGAFKAILPTVTGKQSLSIALTSNVLNNGLKEAPIPPNQDAVDTLKQIDAISLSVTLGKNIEIAGTLIAKDGDSAKKMAAMGNVGVLFIKGMAGQKAKEDQKLQPAVDVLNTVRIADSGDRVTLRAEITQDNFEKLMAILPQGPGGF
ncbi:MAG: hypothetical protein U0744_15585 [Gemmataceae bacterium]